VTMMCCVLLLADVCYTVLPPLCVFRQQIRRFHVPNDVTLPAFKSLVSETLGVSGPLVVKCGSFSCNSDKDFIALLDEASAASPPLLRVTVDLVAAGIAEVRGHRGLWWPFFSCFFAVLS
jgi:hypothetical protein